MRYTIDNHKHKYEIWQSKEVCYLCGLQRSTIEANTPQKPKSEEMDWEKKWRYDLDQTIEDMASYTDVSKLSYEDELFERVLKLGCKAIADATEKAYMKGKRDGMKSSIGELADHYRTEIYKAYGKEHGVKFIQEK